MICTKNGVLAYLVEYGCAVMTDRYDLEGLLILRTTAKKIYDDEVFSKATIYVERIEHWFDQRQNFGTMLLRPGDWREI